MSTRRGSLFVISAPSGSGKTTLVQRLLRRTSELEFSISYTTRAERGKEQDGFDYHFIREGDFERRIAHDEFLEWARVHGNYYGTSRKATDSIRDAGRDVLLDVDVQGAEQVCAKEPDAISLFVLPPSYEVLEQRLRGRKLDSDEVIRRRLIGARREVGYVDGYDYVIINDSLERAAYELECVVRAARIRPHLLKGRLAPILKSFDEISAEPEI